MADTNSTLRRALRAHLLASVSLVIATAPALAQGVTELEPIIIEGAGTPKALENGAVPVTTGAATKSGVALDRLPQAVSVTTGKELEQHQVQSTSEALRYTPGVNSELYGADPRSDWVRVRGYGADEYLDGTRLARGVYAWPRVEPYFLERYEVVKGPNGALYGSNPPGGLINMVTKKPTAEPVRQIGLQFGDPKRAQISADFGGKLTKDGTLTYRLSGVLREADTNVDYVNDDRAALYGALTWRPSENTALTLQAYSINDDAKSLQFLPSVGTVYSNPNGYIPRSTFTGEPDWDSHRSEQKMVGYLFEHRFDNGLELEHTLRWSDSDYDLQVVRAFGFEPASDDTVARRGVLIQDRTKALNADLRLSYAFETGAVQHKITAGIDYLDQTTDWGLSLGPVASLNVFDPVYTGAGPAMTFPIFQNGTDLQQSGVYVQDEITAGALTVLLSARNDWYEQSELNKLTSTTEEASGNQFTWRAGASYQFDNGLTPYVSYATSFEPQAGVNEATGGALKPLEGKQAEIGVKYKPRNQNALYTLSVFDLREQNTVVGSGLGQTQIGETRVRGVELEARAEFGQGFSGIATLGLFDSENTSGSSDPNNGNRLPFVPEKEAALWLDYTFAGALDGLTLGAGVRYSGSMFSNTGNSIETGDYVLWDAAVSYDLKALSPSLKGARFDLSVSNITDKAYVAACENDTACYWGAGRTIRGALVYDF